MDNLLTTIRISAEVGYASNRQFRGPVTFPVQIKSSEIMNVIYGFVSVRRLRDGEVKINNKCVCQTKFRDPTAIDLYARIHIEGCFCDAVIFIDQNLTSIRKRMNSSGLANMSIRLSGKCRGGEEVYPLRLGGSRMNRRFRSTVKAPRWAVTG